MRIGAGTGAGDDDDRRPPADELFEQVDALGRSWRSGAMVERRRLKQWFLAISKMAPELLAGLDSLEQWPDQVGMSSSVQSVP